jgi:tyrosyl-tRNA synthetase
MDLILRNLDNTMNLDKYKLESIISNRSLKIYWGIAPIDDISIDFFIHIIKIADFLSAGCSVKILLADLHAYLDNQNISWSIIKQKTHYYEELIKCMIQSIGISSDKLQFIQGTDFQLEREYNLDAYKLMGLITEQNAKDAGINIIKKENNSLLSSLIYPILQILDEHYLNVDAQFGGYEQKNIFNLAEDFLPKIGYRKRFHLINPKNNLELYEKIYCLDSEEIIEKKIKIGYIKEFIKLVLFPIYGNIFYNNNHYTSYQKLIELSDIELIDIGKIYINRLLEPIRKKFQSYSLKKYNTTIFQH